MFGFGHFPELVVVLVLALIVFGPKKLPEVGGAIGKGIREFRKHTSDFQDSVHSVVNSDPTVSEFRRTGAELHDTFHSAVYGEPTSEPHGAHPVDPPLSEEEHRHGA